MTILNNPTANETILKFLSINATAVSNLRGINSKAEFIIIPPNNLIKSAKQLAEAQNDQRI